ncbi:hypothetical protein C8Q80DRAFT_1321332 [Daedaleopsis nitida]|nr:hypothetical protein C8Q80DRAFT_1321332 [Daedaleopsis nitida]
MRSPSPVPPSPDTPGRRDYVATPSPVLSDQSSSSIPAYFPTPVSYKIQPYSEDRSASPPPEPSEQDADCGLSYKFHPWVTGSPPSPSPARPSDDWTPYDNRVAFELAELLYQKEQMSAGNIDSLLELWHASLLKHGDTPPFHNHTELYETIDQTPWGDVDWESFDMSYGGPQPNGEVPSWMNDAYTVHFRNPRSVVLNMLKNPDFKDEIDYTPFQEFSQDTSRRLKNFLGGDWAWRQADAIAELPGTKDSSFVPIILGSDKTTVSVATGQNDYYPLYLSIGNVHNNVRRAHRNAVAVVAFLAIPKTTRRHANSVEYRKFRRQMFHSSLSRILQPLKSGMTTPEIVRCGDGHFRKVVFGLGPYIADYPEQALLACIVQGWCPVCRNPNKDLDNPDSAGRRTRQMVDYLATEFDLGPLWNQHGIVGDVVPFTNDFPRADIHELLSPDILHQLIKGTFKDHLVSWIELYLKREHREARAAEILAEIDRRIAVVPPFSKLRGFHEGRGFKQWTGDDSKALMKVYLPAIDGLVPSQMVLTIRYFLEFCYLARRDVHNEKTTSQMAAALIKFREHREIFRETGVRPDGFSLPRQHSLEHYEDRIWEFAAPNGLCSSITESKHIQAVKEPWRRSNRHKALGQMLLTNQRLDKISAARVDFAARGMLEETCLQAASSSLLSSNLSLTSGTIASPVEDRESISIGLVQGRRSLMASTRQRNHTRTIDQLAVEFDIPDLQEYIRRFLYHQLCAASTGLSGAAVELNMCPPLPDNNPLTLSIFYSATATFYAPSDSSGVDGMRSEIVRATPRWRNGAPRFDCVFINRRNDLPGLLGLDVARVRMLFSFRYQGTVFHCAAVHWYWRIEDEPDEDTGMWVVKPSYFRRGRARLPLISVVHLDTIVRACHLIGVSIGNPVPVDLAGHSSLDHFKTFFVNKFIDHHAFELLHLST